MLATLPQLHTAWPITEGQHAIDGVFAGLLCDTNGRPYLLIALNAKPPKAELAWRDAMDWAAGQGGDLPNRAETALMKLLGCPLFERDWYWTNEEFTARSAWSQDFDDGGQHDGGKSAQVRGRAVRRIYLDSFGPLVLAALASTAA